MKIIGIDPGLRAMGWGVIEQKGNQVSYLADGVCRSVASASLSERLHTLFCQLQEVFHRWSPEEAAVEETFVNKDARSALKLGHARAISLLVPACFGVCVQEYAPNVIKKATVGSGHADKKQIVFMMKRFFPRATLSALDSADALAIALCHAHHRPSLLR